MGGLSARVQRYLREIRRPHWHIDTLLPACRLTDLWLFPSSRRQECQIARLLSDTQAGYPIREFGSTDCGCPSHLFNISKIKKAPLFHAIKGALKCRNAVSLKV